MFLEDCNLKKGCSLCLKLQLGRINEICGQEASGKTNLALHIIKEAQIKSAEIFCSRMRDQAISHCLMMLLSWIELLLSFCSCCPIKSKIMATF
ncbi:uncharacterized protein LOC142611297 isoform X1 [Castanea sativa]|uniref:uncharacterized protein LOC142611297 isoform X1 n=1 Tax=Castanea sativa TaxID=21020 RepID=UPI003F6549D9